MSKKHITRKLRQDQTPWENKLWQILRNRQVNNLKFRRQAKIGDYIADFVCVSKKLVIELDGGHHNTKEAKEKDKRKQSYIESVGYKVLRFWNHDIDQNIEGVIEEIKKQA